ncbi:MAG: GDP-mannose 4,6-dehydratase [Acidobacteria bacterium]|nr:GDP-mannose 4,6-dehydratase [Acidobacteriota bacterium]
MRVLITGITGFVGSHLADYILKNHPEAEIYGTKRWRSRTENIEHIKDKIKILECDLRDGYSVRSLLEAIHPDKIFHLAAQSFVPTSWNAPAESLTTNILGELNIFEAVKQLKIDPWIQVACSSEQYGLVYEDELPIKETNPLRPLSPYAVSKIGQDYLAYQYYMSYKMKIVRTRGFNHTGPRRGDVFVCSNFARQIVEIEKGKREPVLYVGNLDARRDFTDVRDMVRAYWLALEYCDPGEVYNIASGVAYSIKEVIDMLLSLTDVKIEIKKDPSRLRPSDVPVLIGDSTKFRKKTGWKPEIPFEQTLRDILNYWREKIR